MTEPDRHRSWSTPASAAEVAAANRRRAVLAWVRPASVGVVAGVLALDAAFVLVVLGIGSWRAGYTGEPCSTYWSDLAHGSTVEMVALVVFLVVSVLVSLRWRWVLIATLLVQVVVAAVLVPSTLHARARYEAVADGRLSPTAVATGGGICTPFLPQS